MAGDAIRAQSAQATGRRWSEIRALNYEDPVIEPTDADSETVKPGIVLANDEYALIDTVDEATAEWGASIRIDGYDRLTMLLKHTAGTTTSAVHVRAQVSYAKDAIDAEWFDLFEDEARDGVLVRKDWDWSTSASGNIAWTIYTHGKWIRFKVWTDGADRENSRAILWARRIMDAL